MRRSGTPDQVVNACTEPAAEQLLWPGVLEATGRVDVVKASGMPGGQATGGGLARSAAATACVFGFQGQNPFVRDA